MRRRNFISTAATTGLSILATPSLSSFLAPIYHQDLSADVAIIGGGLGGCAAALSALRNHQRVVLTEETDWIGGQITQQGVPPDEHQWIETHGATESYRAFRTHVRQYYKQFYPLTKEAFINQYLNPGDGAVSRLCHEPKVALAVLEGMLLPYINTGQLKVLLYYKPIAADITGDVVKAIQLEHSLIGKRLVVSAPYFVDATELGDLLPLTGTEYTSGAESKDQTGELHAANIANPLNQQSFTYCFAVDYLKGEDHIIDKPAKYGFWKNHIPQLTPAWPGQLLSLVYANPSSLEPKELGFHPEGVPTDEKLNLWNYRRIINKNNFKENTYPGDITVINWPQNDYMLGCLTDISEKEFDRHIYMSKQLSLSLLYWLQTEVPRPDGGQGWPGIRLRKDIMGTADGLAKYPYVRESRRIKAGFTILEEHVGAANRLLVSNDLNAASFSDSIGIGYYHIDLHPSSAGDNYIDFKSLPFQIPLGALIPQRVNNLLPANKNIGTTHITNGCYRLHPVEWGIGEAVGMLVSFAKDKNTSPRGVWTNNKLLKEFQQMVRNQGIETEWKNI